MLGFIVVDEVGDEQPKQAMHGPSLWLRVGVVVGKAGRRGSRPRNRVHRRMGAGRSQGCHSKVQGRCNNACRGPQLPLSGP